MGGVNEPQYAKLEGVDGGWGVAVGGRGGGGGGREGGGDNFVPQS